MKLNMSKFKPINIILALGKRNIIKISDKKYLSLLYKQKCGRKLNLENPQTFNEKLQWLKLNDRKDVYTTMVDKYEVKKYVANIIGEEYIIPTLGIYNTFDEIDFEKLPQKFVIKCTHDSGSTVICNNKNEFDKKEVKKKINGALKQNYYYGSREWPYKNVKPRIIIEKYITEDSENDLKDYKIFNFNGKSKLIQVDYDRFKKHKRNLYTTNWDLINLQIEYPNDLEHIIEKPKKLDLMIQLAEKLAQKVPYIRTDFYYTGDKIYFGELTLFHGSGFEHFYPESYNNILGNWINIDKSDM